MDHTGLCRVSTLSWQDEPCHPHMTGVQTGVQRGWGACPRLPHQPLLPELSTAWLRAPHVCAPSLGRGRVFATPWTVAHYAPLSMEFSGQEYWSGLPFSAPGDLPHPRIKPTAPVVLALAGRFSTTSATWEASITIIIIIKSTTWYYYYCKMHNMVLLL